MSDIEAPLLDDNMTDTEDEITYQVVLLPDHLPTAEEEWIVGEYGTLEEAKERKRQSYLALDLLGSDYEIREV